VRGVQRRIVVLGTGSIAIDEAVPREGPNTLEELLAQAPEAAVIAAEGQPAFFRASLALEHGVRRIVVRSGSMPDAWVDELSARAAELGGELFARGDDDRYVRVRSNERCEVGAPAAERFALSKIDAPSDGAPMQVLDVAPIERALRCEEVAFAIGLKPVLYLVASQTRVDDIVKQYGDAKIVQQADRCESQQHSGERTYGVGEDVVHMFIGRDAARAAELWADGGSSRHVDELGALMGYPRCCVRAFHAMANRRINAAFPYVTAARTRALAKRFDPLLDVTFARLVPFVPCSYGCREAIAWADAVARASGVERIGRVILYFDEARAIAFEHATVDGDRVAYRGARWAAPQHDERSAVLRQVYGAAFGDEGSLRVGEKAIVIESEERTTSIDRAGGLGVILPFA
jgi:hypothetical protein